MYLMPWFRRKADGEKPFDLPEGTKLDRMAGHNWSLVDNPGWWFRRGILIYLVPHKVSRNKFKDMWKMAPKKEERIGGSTWLKLNRNLHDGALLFSLSHYVDMELAGYECTVGSALSNQVNIYHLDLAMLLKLKLKYTKYDFQYVMVDEIY